MDKLTNERLNMKQIALITALLVLTMLNNTKAKSSEENKVFDSRNFYSLDSNQDEKENTIYLDCQYGQGKWISLTIQTDSNIATGEINDGTPLLFTAVHGSESVSLTPRKAGKKLIINLQTKTVQREWYLKKAVGSAGSGECESNTGGENEFTNNSF